MSQNRLLDVERTQKQRLTTCTAIVVVPNDRCHHCGTPVDEESFDQPALLRHGGYGATHRTTFILCPSCDWSQVLQTQEVRPA